MFVRIKNLEQLNNYLETLIIEREKDLKEFDKARASNDLIRFFHWNGPEMHVNVVKAFEAERLMYNFTTSIKENHEEKAFDVVKKYINSQISTLDTRITARSTSMGANLEQDAQKAFYLELFQKMNDF